MKFLLLFLFALGLLVSCGERVASTNNGGGPLVIGLDPTYPPFEMRDPDGEVTGVSVDLGKALAAELGREVKFEPMDFQGLIPALKSGKIDLVISSMTRTDERAKSVLFSEPYVANGLCLLVPTGSDVKSVEDLNQSGRRVVVRTGTTGHIYARENIGNANLLPQELVETCVAEVRNGNVDAFIYDQLSVLAYAEKNAETMKAIPAPFQVELWAIAMAPEATELKQEVDTFLTKWRTSGGPDAAVEKYPDLSRRKQQLEASGQAFIFDIPEGK